MAIVISLCFFFFENHITRIKFQSNRKYRRTECEKKGTTTEKWIERDTKKKLRFDTDKAKWSLIFYSEQIKPLSQLRQQQQQQLQRKKDFYSKTTNKYKMQTFIHSLKHKHHQRRKKTIEKFWLWKLSSIKIARLHDKITMTTGKKLFFRLNDILWISSFNLSGARIYFRTETFFGNHAKSSAIENIQQWATQKRRKKKRRVNINQKALQFYKVIYGVYKFY